MTFTTRILSQVATTSLSFVKENHCLFIKQSTNSRKSGAMHFTRRPCQGEGVAKKSRPVYQTRIARSSVLMKSLMAVVYKW